MTSRRPQADDRDPLHALRSVRQIQPEGRVARRAVQRALATVGSGPRKSMRWKEVIMRGILAAAILIVIVTAGWLATTGSDVIAAPTWADVTRQTLGIDRVYLDGEMYEGSKLVQRVEIWIKSPSMVRGRREELVDGKMVTTECGIATPSATVHWDERTGLGEYTSTSNRYAMQSNLAGTFEAILGVSLLADRPEFPVTINGESVKFEPVEQKHPKDASLRGFRLRNKDDQGPELVPPFTNLIYWFAARANKLCRLTMAMGEGDEAQRMEMAVTFDPDLPADWFDVKLPAHCFDVASGVAPRLSPEVHKVYEQVQAARKRFGDYRAVIWRDRTGGWPSFREATRGRQWRCDEIDWTVMHSATLEGNRQGYIKIGPDDPFGKLWEQVNRDDYKLSVTAMTWQDKLAFLFHGSNTAQLYGAMRGYEKLFAPSLRLTAWPEWMWWENLHPHGWSLGNPPLQWRLGPTDPEHPERIEVIGERAKGYWTLIRYGFDPGKDWLCVRQQWEMSTGDNYTWEVTEFGQTPNGLWYPRRATIIGREWEYAVRRGAAKPEFFDYPKDIPQPTDPFAEMLSRMDRAVDPQADVPATAKGKYVTVSSGGSARGFDDKDRMQANSEMVQKMDYISHKINEFAHKHRWAFPASLQTLVVEGYLEPDDLHNPLHPDADPPFGYIRPKQKPIDGPNPMVLYEPFVEWPGVVAVVYQDHSLEYIHDQVHFDNLVREATDPCPPDRPATPWSPGSSAKPSPSRAEPEASRVPAAHPPTLDDARS